MSREGYNKKLVIISIVSTFVIIGLWLLTIVLLNDLSETERGTFGDMFGAVNALFSGLAFAGIIITILLQKEELALQRLELKNTRKELKRSADAHERTEKAILHQQNQNTFFKLIENQKKLLETIRFDQSYGMDGIRLFANNIRNKLNDYRKGIDTRKFTDYLQTQKFPLNEIRENKSSVIYYLKTFETIINFIKTNLDNNSQYHTFFNDSISIPEKYLLGILYHYGKGFEVSFLKANLDYVSYFETSREKYLNRIDQYFPNISVFPNGYSQFSENIFEKDDLILGITIAVNEDYFENKLIFRDVNCICKGLEGIDLIKEKSIGVIGLYQEEGKKIFVDLSKFIREEFSELEYGNFEIELIIILMYDEAEYKVGYDFKLFKYKNLLENEEGVSSSYSFYDFA